MYTKILILILLLGICLCSAKPPQFLDPNVQLMQIMSTELRAEGRAASNLACFDYYIPMLNSISAQYEQDYKNCSDKAATDRKQIDSLTKSDRAETESNADDACQNLNACRLFTDSVSYFGCFETVGAANSKQMYQISANASEILSKVQEQYRVITLNEDACQKLAERNYVEGTSDTYEQLNKCLSGQSEVPKE